MGNVSSDADTNGERIVPMRLQKFLARAGVASRRGSENLMTAGRVKVNGIVITELGSKVDPLIDEVTVDDIPAHITDTSTTLALNKPVGYLTTMSDPFDRPCVADLVPVTDQPGLYHIGRLEGDSTGLLLFSADGQLGNALLHPRHHVSKTYEATIEGMLNRKTIHRLEAGITLTDGMTAPARVSVIEKGKQNSIVRISIHEGRNRQVRRMFRAVGHDVCALKRISFGPIQLGSLELGHWRLLNSQETTALDEVVQRSMLK